MKIGITGSKGFIAGHLTNSLRKKSGIKIISLSRPKHDLLTLSSLPIQDIVVHTVAINRGTDQEIIAGSVVATYNLILAIKKLKNKPKIIFLSSIHAQNDSVYGQSKRLAEIMLKDFSAQHQVPVTIFRITNVFGEHCKPFYNSVVATFCYRITRNKKLEINPSRKKINFIYVKNLVKIINKEIFTKRKRLFTFKEIRSKNKISIPELAKLISSFKKIKKLESNFYKNLYKTYLFYLKNYNE
ncbi:hypothetical protein CL633_01680 [bacterium]|nr:hypothetical protein [bacterium]|tara:strand:- start:295 stop:1020 length:726 start_codon:yes stop_codon:yes gene_type:complete